MPGSPHAPMLTQDACSICSPYAPAHQPGFPLDRAATLLAGVAKPAPAPQLLALVNSVGSGRGLPLLTSRINKPLAWAFTPNGKRESDTCAGSPPGLERSGPPEFPLVQAHGALSE